EVGANRVVLHGGSVKVFWEGALKKLVRYREGKSATQLAHDMYYAMLVEKAMSKVRAKAHEANHRLIESLEAILPYARSRGIRLGLENRDGLKETPLDHD